MFFYNNKIFMSIICAFVLLASPVWGEKATIFMALDYNSVVFYDEWENLMAKQFPVEADRLAVRAFIEPDSTARKNFPRFSKFFVDAGHKPVLVFDPTEVIPKESALRERFTKYLKEKSIDDDKLKKIEELMTRRRIKLVDNIDRLKNQFTKDDDMVKRQTVGVIGGMGPLAGSGYLIKLIDSLKTKLKTRPELFPFVELFSNPKFLTGLSRDDWNRSLPDRSVGFAWKQGKFMSRKDIDIFTGPCNTWHQNLWRYTSKFAKHDSDDSGSSRQINMVEMVAKYVNKRGYETVGIIATKKTLTAGEGADYDPDNVYPGTTGNMYYDEFKKAGVKARMISADPAVSQAAVWAVKAAKKDKAAELFGKALEDLKKYSPNAIIAGCTEIPLVVTEKFLVARGMPGVHVVDTAQVLADAVADSIHQGGSTDASLDDSSDQSFVA